MFSRIENFMRNLVLLNILSVSFLICAYNEQSPFELIKLMSLAFFAILVLTIWAGVNFAGHEIKFKWNTALWFQLGVLITTLISYYFSNNQFTSFWGNYNIPTDSLLSYLIYFIYAFLLVQLFHQEKDLLKLRYVLIAVGFFLSVYGIIQHFGYDPVDWWGYSQMRLNAYGTLGQAVAYATIIGCLLPLTTITYLQQSKSILKAVNLFALFIMVLGMMYSGSRTPVALSLLAVLTLLICYILKSKSKTKFKNFFTIFFVIGLTQIIYYSESNSALAQKLQSDSLSTGVSERMQVWQGAYDIWKKYPIVGSGPETFALELKLVNTKDFNTNQNWGLYWHKAHNHIMHYLATVGLLGLVAHLAYAFWVLYLLLMFLKKTGLSDRDWVSFSFLAGYAFIFLTSLTAFNFIVTQFLLMSFPVICLLSSDKTKDYKLKSPRFLNRLNMVLIFTLLGFLSYELFNFWNADRHFTISRRNLEQKNDMRAALDSIDQAILTKSNDCRFTLRKASLMTTIFKYQTRTRVNYNYTEAVKLIDDLTQSSIDCEPNNPETWLYRGKLMAELHESQILTTIDLAEKSFKTGMLYAPINPTYSFQLGMLYLKAGRVGDHLSEMYKVLNLKSDYLSAYVQLLDYYYKSKNTNEVKRLVAEVAKTKLVSIEFLGELNNIIQIANNNSDATSVQILVPVYQKYSALFQPIR